MKINIGTFQKTQGVYQDALYHKHLLTLKEM